MIYNIAVFLCKILFKIFYRVDVVNKSNLEKNKGYMICSNHLHLFDPILIACNVNRPMRFMGKQELFSKKFNNWFLRKLGGFPVDREGADITAIKTAVNILKNNEVLCIFPEGTRSKTGELGEFKSGAGMIAIKGNATIIPVRIDGNYRLFSKMKITFGEEISELGKDRALLMEKVKDSIEHKKQS